MVFLGLGVWGACVHLLVREERCLFEVFFCYQIWGRFISSCDGLYMLRLLAGMKSAHRMIKHKNIVLLNITDAQMRELLV